MRKIKLLFYSCLLGMSALPIQAKVITQSQAQALAAKYVSVGNSGKQQTFCAARKSGQQNAPSFYAFNDSQGKGFVLIAGDDCVNPVLGYSPSGQIDTDNLPPALQAWLQDVSTYISSHRAAGNGTAATAQDAEQGTTAPTVVVAPLIKTKWYQMAPYNDMTPTIGGEHCPTGCVATAMAQVMKYYKWPKRGTNSIKYDTPDYDQKTCDIDFSQSTYDWDNMLEVYGTRYEPDNFTCSEANRQAVAKLMSDAGAAVHMQYDSDGSEASEAEIMSAATYYFSYDANLYYKSDYTLKQWVSIIKKNLDEGCPLVTCAQGQSIGEGHCYVVDGYDSNDYLHVNWGWAGDADGFYSLRQFGPRPDHTFSGDMNFIKMTPNKTGIIEYDAAIPLKLSSTGNTFYANGEEIKGLLTSDVDKLDADLDLYFAAPVWKLYQGEIMLGYTPENGEYTPLVTLKDVKFQSSFTSYASGTARFHIDSDDIREMADGSYQLVIRSKQTPSGMSVKGAPVVTAINDSYQMLMLTKENGKVSIGFVKKTAPLTAKSALTFAKDEYDITDMAQAKIVIANETDEDFYNDNPQLIVSDNSGNTTYYATPDITIYGGESSEITLDIPICYVAGFSEGTAKVSLGQKIDGQVMPLKGIEPVTIKVNRNDDKIPTLEVTEMAIEPDDADAPITDYDNIQFNCNSSVDFSGSVKCKVKTVPEYFYMQAWLNITFDDIVVKSFELNVKDAQKTYIIADWYDVPESYKGKMGTISLQYISLLDGKQHYGQYNGKDFCYKFKVVDTTTGINDVANPKKATEWMRYDVTGRRVNAPVKGLNIIKMSDGTVQKLIVK